jgi:hypothetical protein
MSPGLRLRLVPVSVVHEASFALAGVGRTKVPRGARVHANGHRSPSPEIGATGSRCHRPEKKRDNRMNQVNGHELCADDCVSCAREKRLRLLAEKLNNYGLETRLTTCGVADGHKDAVAATNPRASERGVFHVDDDGSVEWTFPGASLDDDGIGRLVDEAVNALRANGMRLPRRQVKEP